PLLGVRNVSTSGLFSCKNEVSVSSRVFVQNVMSFYDSMSEFYDPWASGDPAYAPSGTFYRSLGLAANGTLVEVGVGTGRIAIELAALGRSVIGIDASEPMLAACRRNAVAAGVLDRLTLCHMDACRLGLCGVDLLTIPFRTIGHFVTPDARRTIFTQVHAALASGGRFAFDHYVFDRAWAEAHDAVPRLMHESISGTGASLVVWDTYRYDFPAGRMDCLITVERTAPNGTVIDRQHNAFPFAWLDAAEVRTLAADVGFKVEAVYGDFNGGAFSDTSPDQVWILRKAGRA
ncbi:class I SAM-dependent methyltransferase, partial [Marichromatium gracile]